jgi:ABC-type enterochelin transport system, ATPase component
MSVSGLVMQLLTQNRFVEPATAGTVPSAGLGLLLMGILWPADELKRTVVLVIHDINFASAYSDRILAMKDGRLVHDGPPGAIMVPDVPEEVFEIPAHVENVRRHAVGIYYG